MTSPPLEDRNAGDDAPPSRPRLSRERIVVEAVTLADRIGVEALTIRRLATALEVKPMTIYHHVANKESILDGMVDLVFAEIELPAQGASWRSATRVRAMSARAVLSRHPWAPPLMESRTSPGPATLRHHNAVLRCLRSDGFSLALAAHAYALLDSYIYGFALQEANLPATAGEAMVDLAEELTTSIPEGEYPYLVELARAHAMRPGYDFADEFEYGLDLILDGLEAAREADAADRTPPSSRRARAS